MSTPREGCSYTSPYAKPVRQYPSQSVDYIAFDVGGQFQPKKQTNCDFSHIGKVSNGNLRRGKSHFFCDTRPSSRTGGYSQQKQKHTPRKIGDTSRNKFHNEGKSENPFISSYLHPSMTEDPWRELIERINAIRKSRISPKTELDSETELESGMSETQ